MPEFTSNQKAAITHANHNILVSASAGSGKTTVLVERVIQKLLAAENPVSLDQMLIVTFTDAAAKEMRDRIEVALKKGIETASQPPVDNERLQALQEQLLILPTANISTLHAFALRLIEHYYHVIDLDPQFRLLADTAEAEMMQNEVLAALFEERYANDAAFPELVQLFAKKGDEGMAETVLRLYNFANARADMDAWLDGLAKRYLIDGHYTQSAFYQNELRPLILPRLERAQNSLATALAEVEAYSDDKNAKKRADFIADELTQLTNLQARFNDPTSSWDELRASFNLLEWRAIAGRSNKDTDELVKEAMEVAKGYREEAKEQLQAIKANYFLLDETSLLAVTAKVATATANLVAIVKDFNTQFSQFKRQKQVLDFSDLEHFALQILQDPATAKTLQARYREIMVDEYQDINPLQETLLTSLSNGHNMFMVGDVKQSIYGFRLADPSLFMAKYQAYQNWDDQTQPAPLNERIILPENFRSHKNVTGFTNMIFTQIMNQTLGDLDYDGSAKLVYQAKVYEDVPPVAELLIYLDQDADGHGAPEIPADGEEVADDLEELNNDKTSAQLLIMAEKIKELVLNGGQRFDKETQQMIPVNWGDIAILEPTRKMNLKLVEIFKAAGIPVVVNDADNYFQTVEINIMLSLLQIIDNPNQDIPLAAVLRSPIVGLGENDLARIRTQDMQGNFYVAVTKFMQGYADKSMIITEPAMVGIYEKLAPFFEQFQQWRQLATQNQLVDLIWRIYEETGYFEYVGGMPAGLQRQANLHALYERAKTFETSSYVGLFSFIQYIEQLRKNEKDLASAAVDTSENAVQVMTIHASKGREFPIVFLLDATHQFNVLDLTKGLLIDDQAGIAMPYLEPTQRLQIDLPQQAYIKDLAKRRAWAEELRVLYVALTRAEQQLYLVGAYNSGKQLQSRWLGSNQQSTLFIDDLTRLGVNNFMDLIGLALLRHPNFPSELFTDIEIQALPALKDDQSQFVVHTYDRSQVLALNSAQMTLPTSTVTHSEIDTINVDDVQQIAKAQAVLAYQYPHQIATQTTAYQSVSEVKRLFEDPDNSVHAQIKLTTNGFAEANRLVDEDFATPKFLEQLTQPSSLAVGSATHLVLQALDLQQVIDESTIRDCIKKLVLTGALTQDVADQIKVTALVQLFATPFGELLKQSAAAVKREQPFSMLMYARELYHGYTGGDERVLIHGIMDGYFVTDDDQLILFDYKTDFVPHGQSQVLVERYQGQLNLYAVALAKIMHRPVDQKYIISLALGQAIPVP
ncbi:helicase-exonuclease AddAB subunit AddA [Periweissella ghanensis]|uniref:ATP-dependent helicase/nuclease subunit A n=1 Tax=Periweissella ghanensis TaxID=467997 RepID=A0ABM8ZCZ0_9LACO|nr:helicase-exonuclease AddAB subunit AddA [Periweissella ghanensis]MCM0600097.1 helicase-exonuclease AddAB subunit AddA [Periweissella ghanensis]CAH0419036.1 ATP-dependent helicase/nuclease subunit A [Periweissella ghanensis]